MNPAIESLLRIVEADPLPAAHTSSYWQRYGRETVVERRDNGLFLRGSGFGYVYARHPALRLLNSFMRMSYRSVTVLLPRYPAVWGVTKRLARDLSFGLTFDVWKSSVVLALLLEHWTDCQLSPRTFAMIGDGYGFLSALIRHSIPVTRMYCIDLPKTLVFQARTHEAADGEATMSVLSAQGGGGTDVIFVPPQDLELISDGIDCAINIASMQEMNKLSIESYFTFLRRRSTPHSRFYCVNRLRKELPGGEITSFLDYPWQTDDEIFIDGVCPYYSRFFAPHTSPNGPRLFGLRIPFVNYFDGVHLHRLVRLARQGRDG